MRTLNTAIFLCAVHSQQGALVLHAHACMLNKACNLKSYILSRRALSKRRSTLACVGSRLCRDQDNSKGRQGPRGVEPPYVLIDFFLRWVDLKGLVAQCSDKQKVQQVDAHPKTQTLSIWKYIRVAGLFSSGYGRMHSLLDCIRKLTQRVVYG